MNTEKFESYFKTPELAQQFLDNLSLQFDDVTFQGKIKVDEVKNNLASSTAFVLPKYKTMERSGYWCRISKMGKIILH